jgi:hypothetical protein
MCYDIGSQTRKQFVRNLIISYLMADDKEKNKEPLVAFLFGTDIPSSQHSMLDLREHAEIKSNITHFENGCSK